MCQYESQKFKFMQTLDMNTGRDVTNGAAMAALLAGGIGTFTLGLIVILNAMGLLQVPALYSPAGGVTGRTTLAVVIWLACWIILHYRWKEKHLESKTIYWLSCILIGMSLLLTFPPVWNLF